MHYNIFEGLTKINEDFSVTPLLAEKWTLLARPEDADLQSQDRASNSRTARPFTSKDVKFSFERYAREGFHQQGQGVLRLDPVDRRAPIPPWSC